MQAIFGDTPEPMLSKLVRFLRRNKKVHQESDDVQERKSQARQHKWTHVHSFYAIMGGFAFDTSQAKPNFLPNGRSRLTLRFEALKYIAEHAPSLIPDLPAEDIRDKSKADSLAKFLVCLQVIWFVTQCIVRLAQKQAISFLELNTFGHAICALLIYALWWHKPLDIDVPSLLMGEDAWEVCALMCVTSNGESFWNTRVSRLLFRLVFSREYDDRQETELSRGQKFGNRVIEQWSDILNGKHLARLQQHRVEPRMILRWDPNPASISDCEPSMDVLPTVLSHTETQSQTQTLAEESFLIRKGDPLFGFRCMDVYTQADWYRARSKQPWNHRFCKIRRCSECRYETRTIRIDADDCKGIDRFERYCTLSPSDLRRWSLCSRAWQRYQLKIEGSSKYSREFKHIPNDAVCDRMSNWPTRSYFNRDLSEIYGGDFGIQLLTITIASGLYGGLHLLAWNALFASAFEQFLWRCSGALIASFGPLLVAFVVATVFHSLAKQKLDDIWPTRTIKNLLDRKDSGFHCFYSVLDSLSRYRSCCTGLHTCQSLLARRVLSTAHEINPSSLRTSRLVSILSTHQLIFTPLCHYSYQHARPKTRRAASLDHKILPLNFKEPLIQVTARQTRIFFLQTKLSNTPDSKKSFTPYTIAKRSKSDTPSK